MNRLRDHFKMRGYIPSRSPRSRAISVILKWPLSLLTVLGLGLLAACVSGPTFDQAQQSEQIAADYAAADRLITGSQRPLLKDAPIIVATLVKLNNLGESSNFGRLVSQHLAARFAQRNYLVPELKLRGTVFVRANQGELMLSRDIQDIAASHQAQAVLVGTYAIASNYVHVNLELVDVTTLQIISAYNYRQPLVADIRALLGLGL